MSENFISVLSLPVRLTGIAGANRFITPVGTVAAPDGNAMGVSRIPGVVGDLVPVVVMGTASVLSGAAIALGQTVKVGADGRAIPWATSGARVGIATEATTATGQLVEVLLIGNAQ